MSDVHQAAKAKDACVSVLRPMVDRRQPWPPEFWYDPYVLGFVVGTIALVSHWTTGTKLSELLGDVLAGTLKEVGASAYDPDIHDRLDRCRSDHNADYTLGIKNAEKFTHHAWGGDAFDQDPDVVKAREQTERSASGPVDRAAVSASLFRLLFLAPVRQRLDRIRISRECAIERGSPLTNRLRPIANGPLLGRLDGCGFTLLGWLSDDRLRPHILKMYWFTLLWVPLLPLGVYVVDRGDVDQYTIYRRLSLWSFHRLYWRRLPLFYMTVATKSVLWIIGIVLALAFALTLVYGVRQLFR